MRASGMVWKSNQIIGVTNNRSADNRIFSVLASSFIFELIFTMKAFGGGTNAIKVYLQNLFNILANIP